MVLIFKSKSSDEARRRATLRVIQYLEVCVAKPWLTPRVAIPSLNNRHSNGKFTTLSNVYKNRILVINMYIKLPHFQVGDGSM